MRWKKQNPVLENTDRVSVKTRTPLSSKTRTLNGTSVLENTDMSEGGTVLENTDILSIPLPHSKLEPPEPPPAPMEGNGQWRPQTIMDLIYGTRH